MTATSRLRRDLRDSVEGRRGYVVAVVHPERLLLLRSTSHVPPGRDERYGAAITWTWTMRLTSLGPGSTRAHLRVRGRMSPWWFAALDVATLVPSDLVMSPGMLRGLRRRAESGRSPRRSGRAPLVTPGSAG